MTSTPATGGPTAETAAPTCYRHPQRETWVRCTRCERSICPDCMREASVGFQCPECVAAGQRTVRAPRTIFGGRVVADSGLATRAIIIANVVLYLVQQVVPSVTPRFAMLPVAVAQGEYYRLVTAAFLHGSLLHIFFNMYALLAIGDQLEGQLGRARFTALYFVSALGGSALSYLLSSPAQFGVGASGAIYGLFGALYVVGRRLRIDTKPIAVLIGINLVLSFAIPVIDWRAHIGGLVTGGLLALAYAYAPQDSRRASVQGGATAAALVVIAGAIVLRTSALHGLLLR